MQRAVERLVRARRRDRRRRRGRGCSPSCRCRSPACSPTRRSPRSSRRAARASRPRARARLRAARAVPVAGLPGALGDPGLKITDRGLVDVDAFELVPLRGVSTLYANAHVVTMDDAGASTPAAGCSSRTASSRTSAPARRPRRRARRPRRRGRHARARQHAPPPLPDADARAGAGGRPLHVAARALPGLGAHRRGVGVRGRAHRARRARAVGLHDRLRPPLRLPARDERARRGGGARGARARRPHRRLARLDGPRRVATAGCRPTRSSRTSTPCSPTPSGSRRLHETGTGALRADRRRAVLAVLGHGRADAASRPRSRGGSACRCTRTSPRRSRRTPTAASSTAARRSSTSSGSAGSPATSGARTACTCRDDDIAPLRRARRRRRALPDVEPAPRRRRRARARPRSTRACASGSASTAPRRTSAATCFFEVKQALLVARGARRAGGADRAGRAPRSARAAARRCSAATTSARSSRASARISRSGGSDGLELGGAEDLVAGLVLSAPHRVDRLYVGGEEVVRDGHLVSADEDEIAREHRRASDKIRRMTSRRTSSTPSAAVPPRAFASSSTAARS